MKLQYHGMDHTTGPESSSRLWLFLSTIHFHFPGKMFSDKPDVLWTTYSVLSLRPPTPSPPLFLLQPPRTMMLWKYAKFRCSWHNCRKKCWATGGGVRVGWAGGGGSCFFLNDFLSGKMLNKTKMPPPTAVCFSAHLQSTAGIFNATFSVSG